MTTILLRAVNVLIEQKFQYGSYCRRLLEANLYSFMKLIIERKLKIPCKFYNSASKLQIWWHITLKYLGMKCIYIEHNNW